MALGCGCKAHVRCRLRNCPPQLSDLFTGGVTGRVRGGVTGGDTGRVSGRVTGGVTGGVAGPELGLCSIRDLPMVSEGSLLISSVDPLTGGVTGSTGGPVAPHLKRGRLSETCVGVASWV